MNLSKLFWHLLVIGIFATLSYLLTRSIAIHNTWGIILAIISLAATIIFLWLLPKLYQPSENESETV